MKLPHHKKVIIYRIIIVVAFVAIFNGQVFEWGLTSECQDAISETCELTDSEVIQNDKTKPTIESLSPDDWTLKIPSDTTALYRVCDHESGVNLSSLYGKIIKPSVTESGYTIEDDENLIFTPDSADSSEGCYTVEIKDSEPLPPANSIIWDLSACDCAGNANSNMIYTSTVKTGLEFFISIPAYILTEMLWFWAIAGMFIRSSPWCLVYDSKTKEPISRAIVRIYSGGELVDTKVSDVNGVFKVKLDKGKYKIVVQHGKFNFPSKVQFGKTDGYRRNLYFGDEILVEKDQQMINMSIPLDAEDQSQKNVLLRKMGAATWSATSTISPYVLLIFGAATLLLFGGTEQTPPQRVQMYSIVAACLGLFAIQMFIRIRERGKYGKVVNTKGRRQSGVLIGLYDRKYNKLIDKTISDDSGLFRFVVTGGLYNIRPVGTEYVLVDPPDKNGVPVGKETDNDILIHPRITVRKTSDVVSSPDANKDETQVENSQPDALNLTK